MQINLDPSELTCCFCEAKYPDKDVRRVEVTHKDKHVFSYDSCADCQKKVIDLLPKFWKTSVEDEALKR